MNEEKLKEIINEKLDDALCQYYDTLELENDCEYSGDITPDESIIWDNLVEQIADLFKILAEHNKIA